MTDDMSGVTVCAWTGGTRLWKTEMAMRDDNPLLPEMARVEERITETADTISLRLSRAGFRPLAYQPGQFNMLGLPGFKEAPFSFSSLGNGDGTFVHTIRTAGNVVSALYRLKPGEKVAFRGPFGTGWPLDKAQDKNLILVAGGIGMAPLRPVVEYVRKNRERFRDVFLLYGAKTPEDLLYKKELAEWSDGITVLLAADEVRGEPSLPVRGRRGYQAVYPRAHRSDGDDHVHVRAAGDDEVRGGGADSRRPVAGGYLCIPRTADGVRRGPVRALSDRRQVRLQERTGLCLGGYQAISGHTA